MRALWVTTRSSNASTVWSLARNHPTYKNDERKSRSRWNPLLVLLLCNLWLVPQPTVKLKEYLWRRAQGDCARCYEKFTLLTLYLPRFLTEHVNTASLPAGKVTFCIVPSNSGSAASNPWRFISGEGAKINFKVFMSTGFNKLSHWLTLGALARCLWKRFGPLLLSNRSNKGKRFHGLGGSEQTLRSPRVTQFISCYEKSAKCFIKCFLPSTKST